MRRHQSLSAPGEMRAEVRCQRRLMWVVVGWLLVSACATAEQLEAIQQMVRTSWTGRSGAPQGITALAQTPDGRLWIGTVAGLYSYDGYTFRPFPMPLSAGVPAISRKVQSLFVSRDGGLWVVGLAKGAVYLHGTSSVDAGIFEGQHARFDSLQQDRSGRIWAVVNDHDVAWCAQDHIWHVERGPVAHPTLISGIFIDSRNTLWAVVDDHLYRRADGDTNFEATGIVAEGGIHFVEASDGNVWLVGQTPKRYKGEIRGIDLRRFDPEGHLLAFPFVHSDVNAILVSHDGSLWVLENDIGKYGERSPALTRYSRNGDNWLTDRITSAQGLGNSDSHAMVEDADGSIWIGGERQLERFRASTLVPLTPGLVGSSWILCANPQGSLWVGSRSGLLMHFTHGRSTQVHGQDGPYKLVCRDDGSTWMLDARGLSLVEGTSVHRLPLLSGHGSYLDNWGFSDVLETRDHRVIVAEHGASESKLWQFVRGGWQPFVPDLNGTPIHASLEDTSGTLYLGGLDGYLAAVHDKTATRLPVEGGLLGNITAFQQTSSGLFVLGSEGIAVYKSGVFQRLLFAVPENAEMVSGLVQAADGEVWINGQRGIIHVPALEMQAGLEDPGHGILSSEMHESDFVGPAMTGIASASAVRDDAGTLWFGTLNGVVSLNRSAFRSPVKQPDLHIESADADGKDFNDHASLPPNVATLRIRYLGLNVTRPEDVVYSYRMQGVDRDWQTVGKRTEAVYTGLKPADYRFFVKASYGDGNWTQPVELSLQIRPAFYQRWWFIASCILLCVVCLVATVSLRFRFLANTLRERAEQRAEERIRIARELHDTLLQGMQGLLMSFHVAAQSTPESSRTRHLLERALQSADRLLVEGRNRVSDLRGEHLAEHADLQSLLRRAGEDLAAGEPKLLKITSQGEAREMQRDALGELYFVGREALTNAYRHSGAAQIEVVLQHGPKSFAMLCIDNGRGIDLTTSASQTDHWGLRGMKERVQRLGGNFHIESGPAVGTKVVATFPAGNIYRDQRSPSFWLRHRPFRRA